MLCFFAFFFSIEQPSRDICNEYDSAMSFRTRIPERNEHENLGFVEHLFFFRFFVYLS